MIVDVHTHFPVRSELTSQLMGDMLRCGCDISAWDCDEQKYVSGTSGADRTFLFGLRAMATGWEFDDERIAAFAARSDRCAFFASIDPLNGDYLDVLRDAHARLGCAGVKLGPVYQNVHPHDVRYYDIYRYCQTNGLPIMTHMAATFSSGVPLEYARPILMDKVACDFPDLKIILAHLGHPWIEETITVVRKQPNLYSDISALYYRPWQFYCAMRILEEYGAANKVFFGSDFPARTTRESIEGLRNVNHVVEGTGLPRVSDRVVDEVLYKNPFEVLKI